MKQIQKQTVRTPFLIQIFFWIWMLVPLLIITTIYSVIDVSAATYKVDCRTAWEQGFFERIDPSVQKACGKKFEFYTRKEIQRFIFNHK